MKIVGINGTVKGVAYSLSKGMSRHGDFLEMVSSPDKVINADAFIQTNMIKPKIERSQHGPSYQYIIDSKKPFLVNESAAFRDHLSYTRLGWYSYKWTEGIFGNENSPRDRWLQFEKSTNIKFKDWRSVGSKIVIMGQKEGDSSLLKLYEDYESFYDWVEKIILDLTKYTDRPILLRPHPRNLSRGEKLCLRLKKKYPKLDIKISKNVKDGVTRSTGGEGLQKDLQDAYCVITYNSLSGVDSVIQGIPTFAFEDGSMVWPIAHKDLKDIESLRYDIDIVQWQNDIAYCQWTNREHAKGESWSHLKPLLFKD